MRAWKESFHELNQWTVSGEQNTPKFTCLFHTTAESWGHQRIASLIHLVGNEHQNSVMA
jgi:hypothetical protein